VAAGSQGLTDVVTAFGPEVLGTDGELDRKRVGSLVFADPDARKRLNAITHPIVRRLSQERFAALERQGVPLAGYDVPLLFEVGLGQVLRPVVVVAASEETQLARVQARDGLSEAEARARLAAQLPLAQKRALADHVIDNDGSREDLSRQVDELVRKLRAP
jgi:dephospho-CoA kinase